jgi:hypothetical protein
MYVCMYVCMYRLALLLRSREVADAEASYSLTFLGVLQSLKEKAAM